MKFIYTGHCAKGFVQFQDKHGASVKMPSGEAVDVPDWLAKKLATNSHFEAVIETKDGEVMLGASQKRRGRPPKAKDETEDDSSGA